jgi:PD-(D/E)XK endonuclease
VKTKSEARLVRGSQNLKQCGELAELAFTYKAASLGFGVARPFGDSERYDFILDSGRRLLRVQVKSVDALRDGAYYVNAQRRTGKGVAPYSASEIDFLVAHVIPEDAWFVIPVRAVMHLKTVRLYPPGPPRGEYWQYREAWQLMKPRVKKAMRP